MVGWFWDVSKGGGGGGGGKDGSQKPKSPLFRGPFPDLQRSL